MRSLKRLEAYVDISITDIELGKDGWYYTGVNASDAADPIYGHKQLCDVYKSVDPYYNSRFTVPVLYDKKEQHHHQQRVQ